MALLSFIRNLGAKHEHGAEPAPNTRFVPREEPETIIVSPTLAAANCAKMSEKFLFERNAIDDLNLFCKEELPTLLQDVLANTTYHYTMFDTWNQGPYSWMKVRELRSALARELWNAGFMMTGGQGDYGRTLLKLRTPELQLKTWKEFAAHFTEMAPTEP